MKRLLVPILCVMAMAMILSCGGKYSDAIKYNKQHIHLTERYVADLDDADNAAEVAKAMNTYADELEELWPKMKEVSEKYPELRDTKNQPKEMQALRQEADEMGKRFAASMMKIMPHMGDSEVRKAQQRISTIMTG